MRLGQAAAASLLRRFEQLPQPSGGLLAVKLAGSDGQSELLPRRAVGLRRKVIQAQENEARTERGAFVAIHERMILAEIK